MAKPYNESRARILPAARAGALPTLEEHEWFTLAEAAEIWGAKDGIAGMVRLILEGDERLTASYILPTPWKASYIKRIEGPSVDEEKWYSPELKEIWSVYIEMRGLIDLYFSGECRNADGSITIRGDGSIKSPDGRWPERAKVYVTLPGSGSTSLSLISTGEAPEELQGCLNIEPEHDLIVTRDHLKYFARTVGKSSVLVKLESRPASGNVAASEILIEYKNRIDIGRKQQQTHVVFDATKSTKKYRVLEGQEPVRLASTSGHVLLVGEDPRHICVGFEQEALGKGCIAVEDDIQTLPGMPGTELWSSAKTTESLQQDNKHTVSEARKNTYDNTGRRGPLKTMLKEATRAFIDTKGHYPDEGEQFNKLIGFIFGQMKSKPKPNYLKYVVKVIPDASENEVCVIMTIKETDKGFKRHYVADKFFKIRDEVPQKYN